MAYNDQSLRDSIRNDDMRGDYKRRVVDKIDQYINQLSPGDLIGRYDYLTGIDKNNNIDNVLNYEYGATTAQDKAYYTAYKSAKEALGRDLTPQEFAQIAPTFYNPADYGSGVATGRQYLAAYAAQHANDPQNLIKKAPGQYGAVDQVFSSMLGRPATQEEKDHFGSLLASGQVDPYQLQDFIRGTTEYQSAQDKTFRSGLADELQGYDTKFFGKAKQDVLSSFADTGQLANHSSALDFALTDLMGKIADKRGEYLSNLSAQQYGSNKDLALGNYKNQMDTYLGNQDYARRSSDARQNSLMDRSFQGYDYATQRNDYMDYLNSQKGGGKFPWGQAIGGALGGGLGAFGGPQGAAAGYQIGSATGGLFDWQNQRRS